MNQDLNNRAQSYRLHRSIGYQLSLTARLQERTFEEALRPLGLTRITWCVLLATGVEGHEQPSEIAGFVGIDRTATSRALRRMEASGMICRSCGKGDRRTTRVKLTDKGWQLLEKAAPLAQANAVRFTAKLTAQEVADLHQLLKRLQAGENTALRHL